MGLFESFRKRGFAETLKRVEENVVWDVMDAVPADKAPLTTHENLPDGAEFPLMNRLFNRGEKRDGYVELWKSVETLAPGTYAMRMNVGKSAEGTAHPHFLLADRDEGSATLLFVNPEHYLNKTKRTLRHTVREGDVRPKVCNLTVIRMHGANALPDIAVTRFRTGEIQNPVDVSFETQLGVARQIFQNQGMPPMLEGKEHEMLFRLIVEPSSGAPMLLQSRYTKDEAELSSFLQTGNGSSFLEGKRRAFTDLMEEFSARIKRGEFKSRPDLVKTS